MEKEDYWQVVWIYLEKVKDGVVVAWFIGLIVLIMLIKKMARGTSLGEGGEHKFGDLRQRLHILPLRGVCI